MEWIAIVPEKMGMKSPWPAEIFLCFFYKFVAKKERKATMKKDTEKITIKKIATPEKKKLSKGSKKERTTLLKKLHQKEHPNKLILICYMKKYWNQTQDLKTKI